MGKNYKGNITFFISMGVGARGVGAVKVKGEKLT